jgi:hypothetical protein
MNYKSKLAAMLVVAGLPITSAIAQVQTDTTIQTTPTSTTNVSTPLTPTQMLPTSPPQTLAAPSGAVSQTQLKTETADEFLSSLATKFGTSVSRLKSLLAKLPPHGQGLNRMEISVISSKLGLTPEEKQVFKSRVGAGGTGFTAEDVAGMGVRLGLSDVQTARLSQELGLSSPAIATPLPMTPTMPASTESTGMTGTPVEVPATMTPQ